jgi:hypothetical protein
MFNVISFELVELEMLDRRQCISVYKKSVKK